MCLSPAAGNILCPMERKLHLYHNLRISASSVDSSLSLNSVDYCGQETGAPRRPPTPPYVRLPVYGDFLALLVTSVPVVLEAPSLTSRILSAISGFRLSISTSAKDAQNFGCVAQTDSALRRVVTPTTMASADFSMLFRKRFRFRSHGYSP